MKKLTLLIAACSMAFMSYAVGGNITYTLNGGVTNDYGWGNKADMLVGLNQDYNTKYAVAESATWYNWETLSVILGTADPVARIPTFASSMWGVITTPKWQWLHDYIVTIVADQKVAPIAEAENAYWRYNVSAFIISGHRVGWPASANYIFAGQPDAFMAAWKQGFAGPATYDGDSRVILPDPYKEGFTFDGWYEMADFQGEKLTVIPAGAEGDKALHAKWINYIPTIAEVKVLTPGTSTQVRGVVRYFNGTTAYIQDVTGGLMVEFTTAPDPVLAFGNKVTLSAKTTALGDYVKLTEAAVTAREASSLPFQLITLATLTGKIPNPGPYMFEYVKIEGLNVTANVNGVLTLTDDTENSITMTTIPASVLPAGTKVSLTGVVSVDNNDVVLVGNAANIVPAPVPRPDPAIYAALEEGKYTLTNKWLVSNNMDNLSANPVGTSGFVRGMTAQDGKMYFADRALKQLTVIDGATGKRLDPLKLDTANIFKSKGVEVGYPYNDIKQDNAGNILLANLITSAIGTFQVWKIDLATGNGTLILEEVLADNPDFAEATIRFDAFGVYGDVDGNAIIMAANASAMEAYKWTITDGVVGDGEVIQIATDVDGNFLKGLINPGSAPQIFPMDEDYFYLDGNATLPTLIDMEGTVVDGFYNVPTAVEDWSTTIDKRQGHNGLVEFELGGEYFFLIASTNTAGTPPSAFRLLKWADAFKEFKDIQSLWTLPEVGMGGTSNAYRSAVPSVEVNEVTKTATLYLYTGENGYGVYEFKINEGSGVNDIKNSVVKISIVDKIMNFDKEVASVAVYSVAGQLVAKANNTSTINVLSNGVFVVKAITYDGKKAIQKVIVK